MIKKTLLTLLSLCSLAYADIYNLKAIKVTKDISCIIGDINPPTKQNNGFVSNMCYVDMGNSLVVLDAGPTYIFAKEFYDLMKKEYPKLKVSHVVLTNFHDDRTQGASFFKEKGAKIVGYKNLNEDMENNMEKFKRMGMLLDPKVLKDTKLIKADTLVDDGFEIKGSKKKLTIIKPSEISEEKSDIAIYSKDDSFIFAGNIVFTERMLNYTKNSNVEGWIEALKNLAKLDAEHFLGGHGKYYHKGSYKETLEYLQILRDDVKKAYEEGIDIIDAKKHVHTEKFNYLNYYEQLNAHNITNYYNQLEWE